MKRIALTIGAFIGVQLATAFIMWVGGYDFDQRNPFVAMAVIWSLMLGGIAALWAHSGGSK